MGPQRSVGPKYHRDENNWIRAAIRRAKAAGKPKPNWAQEAAAFNSYFAGRRLAGEDEPRSTQSRTAGSLNRQTARLEELERGASNSAVGHKRDTSGSGFGQQPAPQQFRRSRKDANVGEDKEEDREEEEADEGEDPEAWPGKRDQD